MAFVVQILCLVLIICIGIIIFQFFPRDFSVKKITITAMFVVLSAVLQALSLVVPLFGFPSLKLGFSQMPLVLLGALLGPMWAYVGGLCQDLLSLFMDPTNFPFFGFTLNKIVIALIPAFWFHFGKKISQKVLLMLTEVILVITYILALLALWTTNDIVSGGDVIVLSTFIKIGVSLLIVGLLAILCYGIYYFYQKYQTDNNRASQWIISIISVEVIVQYCLTPLWLQVMNGIPFMGSLLVRLVKGSVMIFLNIFIGLILYQILSRFIKDDSEPIKDIVDAEIIERKEIEAGDEPIE